MVKRQRLTVAQVARITGAHQETIRGWARRIEGGETVAPRGRRGRLSIVERAGGGFFVFDRTEVYALMGEDTE